MRVVWLIINNLARCALGAVIYAAWQAEAVTQLHFAMGIACLLLDVATRNGAEDQETAAAKLRKRVGELEHQAKLDAMTLKNAESRIKASNEALESMTAWAEALSAQSDLAKDIMGAIPRRPA